VSVVGEAGRTHRLLLSRERNDVLSRNQGWVYAGTPSPRSGRSRGPIAIRIEACLGFERPQRVAVWLKRERKIPAAEALFANLVRRSLTCPEGAVMTGTIRALLLFFAVAMGGRKVRGRPPGL